MFEGQTVAVVVPAYNEEGYVGAVIDSLPAVVDRAYVVDDGSTDGTWAEMQRHTARVNDRHEGVFSELVIPIRHPHNRGVGGAIKTGYLRARDDEIDITAVLAGDAQMDPGELPRYLEPIADGRAAYAKGNRFAHPDHWAAIPRFRLVGNVVLSYLTKLASGYWSVMDSQNGYTAISLEALQRTDIEGMYEYYGYCNDLLVRLNEAEMTIADVPRSAAYAYTDGWKSHIDYTEYIPRVSVMLARGFVRRIVRRYLLTDYHPAGPAYLLGMLLTGASTIGLLITSLRRRKRSSSWLLAVVVGLILFGYGTVLDRAANLRLERHLDDRVASETHRRDTVQSTGTASDERGVTDRDDERDRSVGHPAFGPTVRASGGSSPDADEHVATGATSGRRQRRNE